MSELPPLQATPHLSRLLWPGEEVIYTAKLHWLNGWYWLVLALVALGLTFYVHPFFAVAVALCGVLWLVPLRTNQIAVTTRRLLYRVGRFKLELGSVEPNQLHEWRLVQTPLTNAVNTGTILMVVSGGRELRRVHLPMLAHPLTFLEALETLEFAKAEGKIG